MRSKVTGFRSAELLPTASVVISLRFSDKMNNVCFFVCFFMSEAKSGRSPRATCGTRNRRLRLSRESDKKKTEDRNAETTARK